MNNTEKTMDKIVALCKNRGFVFPGSEIYGGLANTWDYGPLGAELKKNIKNAARKGGVLYRLRIWFWMREPTVSANWSRERMRAKFRP